MRSGDVFLSHGTLDTAGLYGYSWTLLTHSSDSAGSYTLIFRNPDTNPSGNYRRFDAFPVRWTAVECLRFWVQNKCAGKDGELLFCYFAAAALAYLANAALRREAVFFFIRFFLTALSYSD